MRNIYIDYIARAIGVKDWQVENCVHLFEEGNTIPFISRYRKEKTGGLDDVAVAEIKHWNDVFTEMEKRKEGILSTISEQGKLTDELRSKIENCVVASELEDLYLPYRPKRRTRATMATRCGRLRWLTRRLRPGNMSGIRSVRLRRPLPEPVTSSPSGFPNRRPSVRTSGTYTEPAG